MQKRLMIWVIMVASILSIGCDDDSVARRRGSVDSLGVLVAETGPLFLSGVETDGGLYFAGGTRGAGGGRIFRLTDGRLSGVPSPVGQTLWWIWEQGGDLYASGEAGRVIRNRDGVWMDISPIGDRKVTFWGGWTSSLGKTFVAGGSRDRFGPKALLYSLDRAQGNWDRIPVLAPADTKNFYKVWGDQSGRIFAVGEDGTIVQIRGGVAVPMETPTKQQLFTIHGNSSGDIYAVGGTNSGVVLRLASGAWSEEAFSPQLLPLSGVYVRENGVVFAVGDRGQIVRRNVNGIWSHVNVDGEPRGIQAFTLHAVFGQEQLFAVGGNFRTGVEGVLVFQGEVVSFADEPTDSGFGGSAIDGRPDGVPDTTTGTQAERRQDVGLGDGPRPLLDAEPVDDALVDGTLAISMDTGPDTMTEDSAPSGSTCGDGILHELEECDDGNLVAGDGCDPGCRLECGNGSLEGTEACDDGNRIADDGCDSRCQFECGNHIIDGLEECDDGNRIADDGCDSSCRFECGNGVINEFEECDDGNSIAGDGCDETCTDERPRIGEVCLELPCRGDLECLGVADADFVPVCTLQCAEDDDCVLAGFVEDVVCDLIGPQLIDTYCVPTRCLDGEC